MTAQKSSSKSLAVNVGATTCPPHGGWWSPQPGPPSASPAPTGLRIGSKKAGERLGLQAGVGGAVEDSL